MLYEVKHDVNVMEGIWDGDDAPETSKSSQKFKRRRGVCEGNNATSTLAATTENQNVNNDKNIERKRAACEGLYATGTLATTVIDSTSKKSYWKHVEREYSDKDKRVLVAEFLAFICKIIMGNQIYNFGGKTYVQSEHGSIGDEAVGMMANLVMIWWARRLKERLDELKIEN